MANPKATCIVCGSPMKWVKRGGQMPRTITTNYDGSCADCGAALPAGSKARYYGRGKLYGVTCHGDSTDTDNGDDYSFGGRCEDYPCCGHGPPPMGDGGGCPVQTRSGPRYKCVLCGALMPPGRTSSICDGYHSRESVDRAMEDDDY